MGKHDKKAKADKDEPAYLEFRLCRDKCLKCKGCGYYWGLGHDTKAGERAYFGSNPPKEDPDEPV